VSFSTVRMKFALSANDGGVWGDEPDSESATPVLRSTEIGLDGLIDPEGAALRKLSSRELRTSRLRGGDILVVKSSGSDAHLGKSGWVDQRCTGMSFSNFIQRLRVSGDFDSRFTWYFMNCNAMKEQVRILSSTTTGLQNLSASLIREIEIPRPPVDKQRRIADFLDAETARIDSLQAARSRQLAALDELAASHVSAIVPSTSRAPFVRLGYLAVIQSGVTVDSNRDVGEDAVALPYLRVANVQDGHVDLESVTEITVPRSVARSSTLRYGDVLMTEGGDLDKLGRGTVWLDEIKNCLHQNHVFAVRPDQRKLAPEYLALLTRTAHARSYFESTGTKTTNLASTSSSKIRDFRIPLIDLAEQARIYREMDAWLKEFAKVQSTLRRQSSLLAERRQALITAAVTGGISV
jgi:type I restriction enzyme, S subunit